MAEYAPLLSPESIQKGARSLRLAMVTNIYKQGFITTDQAKEILRGRLSPDDPTSAVDDSALLDDPQGLKKIEAG